MRGCLIGRSLAARDLPLRFPAHAETTNSVPTAGPMRVQVCVPTRAARESRQCKRPFPPIASVPPAPPGAPAAVPICRHVPMGCRHRLAGRSCSHPTAKAGACRAGREAVHPGEGAGPGPVWHRSCFRSRFSHRSGALPAQGAGALHRPAQRSPAAYDRREPRHGGHHQGYTLNLSNFVVG